MKNLKEALAGQNLNGWLYGNSQHPSVKFNFEGKVIKWKISSKVLKGMKSFGYVNIQFNEKGQVNKIIKPKIRLFKSFKKNGWNVFNSTLNEFPLFIMVNNHNEFIISWKGDIEDNLNYPDEPRDGFKDNLRLALNKDQRGYSIMDFLDQFTDWNGIGVFPLETKTVVSRTIVAAHPKYIEIFFSNVLKALENNKVETQKNIKESKIRARKALNSIAHIG